eukprot:CAMPEP_0119004946 /NCGR_PEP_ID=MMETSP1176-20130426/1446_1 /TAXON_ID=265551 /ORGANISM="Synedropsis recta cf, Strain CCMP1620" /LENGTH=275 /DNA_ID=CAMNT_0006956707 /DNA_START=741 /DNA_END=1568 /DNA_ORIENTATION=-
MRNWTKTKNQRRSFVNLEKTLSSASDPSKQTAGMISQCNGPELLLNPIHRRSCSDTGTPIAMPEKSNRPQSFESRRPRSSSISRRKIWNEVYAADDREQEEKAKPFSIPVYDVVVVDTKGSRHYTAACIYLTTANMGYFEFSFSTANAHDIFMAFLTNTLPYERITRPSTPQSNDNPAELFDVEQLTATRMYERVEAETFPEKMRRKMVFMANRIGELSYSLSEACACGCEVHDSPTTRSADNEGRQSPPRTFEFPIELEVETQSTTAGSHYSPR